MKVKCLLALVVVVACIADNFAAKVEEEKSKEKGLASKKKRDRETDIAKNQQVQHEVQDPTDLTSYNGKSWTGGSSHRVKRHGHGHGAIRRALRFYRLVKQRHRQAMQKYRRAKYLYLRAAQRYRQTRRWYLHAKRVYYRTIRMLRRRRHRRYRRRLVRILRLARRRFRRTAHLFRQAKSRLRLTKRRYHQTHHRLRRANLQLRRALHLLRRAKLGHRRRPLSNYRCCCYCHHCRRRLYRCRRYCHHCRRRLYYVSRQLRKTRKLLSLACVHVRKAVNVERTTYMTCRSRCRRYRRGRIGSRCLRLCYLKYGRQYKKSNLFKRRFCRG